MIKGTLHAAAVRGVKLSGGFVLSAGCDQRVILWQTSVDELVMLAMVCVEVADVSTLEISPVLEDNSRLCVVAGVGMTVLRWHNSI